MPETKPDLRSYLKRVAWPAVPSQHGAMLQSMQHQLDETQWWSAARLLEHQLLQLNELLQHAYDSVPYYRRRFDAIGFRPGQRLTIEAWRELPLLTRREVQSAGSDLASSANLSQYGGFVETQTSGSTGEPVRLRGTGLDQLLWEAITLREHHWHGRDLSGKLASIRVFVEGGEPPDGTLLDDWGPPTSELYATGPAAMLSLTADIETQARWLLRQEPDYLLTYPTNLMALIAHFSRRGDRLRNLRAVRTVGETVTPALRVACRDVWGVPLVDVYSSQELGCIAAQCPVSGQYHVMAESVLVEIIGSDGMPCRPGEIGRLVVTKLHNFATPLIRYELRDHAEAGAPCPCGRGLPTMARILGRSRNLLTLPTGEQSWPVVGFREYRDIAPVLQYQLVQLTLQDIEVRFAVDRPLTDTEESRLATVIQRALGYPFRLKFVYFPDEIPRGPGGKFEEFVSRLDASS
jgi:phenylacetate-CoA ligase